MMNNGYQQYKKQCTETMTKGEILVLLFDEANKKLLKAKTSYSSNSIEDFEKYVQESIDIMNTLVNSLDGKFTISTELYRLYDYIIYEMNRVKIGRNISLIENISEILKDLSNTFREAEKKTKGDGLSKKGIMQSKGVSLGIG